MKNIFEWIEFYGSDRGFEPPKTDLEPTDRIPGSEEKIAVYRERLEKGLPLNHEDDLMLKQRIRTDETVLLHERMQHDFSVLLSSTMSVHSFRRFLDGANS